MRHSKPGDTHFNREKRTVRNLQNNESQNLKRGRHIRVIVNKSSQLDR